MVGEDFQDRLDAIVSDLQTTGKGQTVGIAVRDSGNSFAVLPLSSDANGVVNVVQLAAVQNFFNLLKPIADQYEAERAPVQAALEAFQTAQTPHQILIDAASQARKDLNDALLADANYQTKKMALENARANVDYVGAMADYRNNNVSENFGNLGDAKGKYAVERGG